MVEDAAWRQRRAEAALESWLARRMAGTAESEAEFLSRHADLRDLLESGLREEQRLDATLSAAARPSAEAGRKLGDFLLLRELGRGGMGIVYEAEQVSLGRLVALKVLPAHLTMNERGLERFRREAVITAHLQHPGVIEIHAVGEADGVHFFAMELIRGGSLAELIERMRKESFGAHARAAPSGRGSVVGMSSLEGEVGSSAKAGASRRPGSSSAHTRSYVESAARLAIALADALEHAHRAGVVHRDVKPSNVLLREDGTPVLTDFGLAREEGLPSVTVTGEFAGTPHYVSPEQAMARRLRVDHRTDVFSLGATFYELLTLQRAFDGEDYHEVLRRIISKEPVRPDRLNPALPRDLVTILLKALEKDVDRRYASAADLSADLRAFLERRPIRGRRVGPLGRTTRWVRREPIKAVLAGVLLAGLPALAVLAVQLTSAKGRLGEAEPELRARRVERMLEDAYIQLGDVAPAWIEARRNRSPWDLSKASFERVEGSFQSAFSEDPRSLEAAAGLALTYQFAGEPQAVLDLLDGLDAELRAVPGLRRLRAVAFDELGRDEEAARERSSLAEPSSALECFVEGWGALLSAGGESAAWVASADTATTARAVELLSRAVALSRDPRTLFHFSKLRAELLAGLDQDAAQTAAVIESFWPENAAAWFHVGCARGRIDPRSGVEAFERALEIKPGLAEAWSNMADLLYALGEHAQALAAFRSAATAAPVAPHIYNLGWVLTELGRASENLTLRDEGLSNLRRAVQLDPYFGSAGMHLANELKSRGFQREQLAVLQDLTERLPDHYSAWNEYAWLLVDPASPAELKDPVRGLEAALWANELYGPDEPWFLDTLAEAFFANGRFAEAVSTEDKALAVLDRWEADGTLARMSVESPRPELKASLERFRTALSAAGGSGE